jgi:hypothetical protein
MAQPVEQGLKQELARGQPFDHTHRRAAAGARPRAPGARGDGLVGRFGGRRDGQGLTTLGQFGGAAPRREEADVANPDEAFREDVEEKAPEEFLRVDGECAELAAVAIVLPPKGDRVVGDGDEAVIRNRDAVRVPREVVQHVRGTAKGRLRVDHPRLAIERSEIGPKGRLRREGLEPARKLQPALRERLAQAGHQFAAIDLPEHRYRQEEGRARVDPARAVGGEPPGRHDAMDVGMMLQALAPGVEDQQSADRGPQALGVGGDLEERGRRRAEEEVVHDALVHERQPREYLGHGKDDVHVAHRQEFPLARGHPQVAGRGEALGAMSIPAAVEREGRLRALITAIAVPAQRRRAAPDQRPEDASMLAGEPGPLRLEKPIAESAHDVSHLERWPTHGLRKRRDRGAVSGAETGNASSGLATACKCRCDRWR